MMYFIIEFNHYVVQAAQPLSPARLFIISILLWYYQWAHAHDFVSVHKQRTEQNSSQD